MEHIYKPYSERTVDTQYEDLLRKILKEGKRKETIHAKLAENKGSGHEYCLELSGEMLKYDLRNGVPILPIRDQSNAFKGAVGEVVAFINGARTLEKLREHGCPDVFWDRWVTKEKCEIFGLPEHDLGGGSYGAVLASIPTPDGKTFNQVQAVVNQMKRAPHLRTHYMTTWYPPLSLGDKDQGFPRQVVVAPCHGNAIQFNVFPDGEMHMVHYQRSADVPVGLVLNLAEWVAFGMMVAEQTGLKFTEYTHFLANPQIYDVQIPAVEEMLKREPRKLPSLYLKPKEERKSVFEYRKEDFVLEDYEPHPKMVIPTAI
ncbi:MAG: thymidylate synthase, thymidylate synthase [Candidatus Parcubacteria bacterium]|jgi:thymidylate synthase